MPVVGLLIGRGVGQALGGVADYFSIWGLAVALATSVSAASASDAVAVARM